jgi:hypothetical protein
MFKAGIMVSLKPSDPENASKKGSALQQFRARQKREGMARVELQVRREDAVLMRHIARDLADPDRSVATRQALLACINRNAPASLKEHLLLPAIGELALVRSADTGRAVDL